MEAENLIPLQEIVRQHEVSVSFVEAIRGSGLIHIIIAEEQEFVPVEETAMLEKLIRLHHELDINFEGVEAISYLLMRMERLQEELTVMKNRLRLYE
jgi:hypothetical protein